MGKYLCSSIGKKQIVGITGLALVLFLFTHLAGNLLIYKGPEAFNAYSQKLHDLGALLWVARIGLLAAFVAHLFFTILVVIENKKARPEKYAVENKSKEVSWTAKSMHISGPILLIYIIIHLLDYTFTSATPANATVMGQDLGLYGLVYNSYLNPIRAIGYIIGMIAVGLHLSHGVQSVLQTFGLNDKQFAGRAKRISLGVGAAVAIGFASIPIYVTISHQLGCAFGVN